MFSSQWFSIVVVVSGVLVVRMVSHGVIRGVGVGGAGGIPAAVAVVEVLPPLLSLLPLWWWWWCGAPTATITIIMPLLPPSSPLWWWGGCAPAAPSCPLLLLSPTVEGMVRLNEKEKVVEAHLHCRHPPRHHLTCYCGPRHGQGRGCRHC